MTLLGDFVSQQDFDLDDFQLRACQSIEAGRGVVVCAPTGAGKTIVGEFAIYAALDRGGKCFYTTPIKALSNQKYHDLVEDYGEDRVGLLTGDTSINGDADIVVMTTEVLRNMIYAKSPTLKKLTHVVMDEIHYLADRERGAVWEEVILNLDESVAVIGLSATVSNSEEFGRWLSTVRGHTDVIVTDLRPVPLHQHMLVGNRLYPLFEAKSDKVNQDLLEACRRAEFGYGDAGTRERYQYKKHKGGGRSYSWGDKGQRKFRPPKRGDVIRMLGSMNMLPAIVFIFSRAGCEGALAQVGATRAELTDRDEQDRIAKIIDDGVAHIPKEDLQVLGFLRWRRILIRGFAAHHAGMLPAFRHIVEELFNEGLVKVVFATETLALGINMPARTVVLEKLVKYNGEAHVDLTPGQYTQMTGRAGRRGIDTVGNAVVQWAPAMDPKAVAGLASTRTYPLISTFAPSYNMSVNLLQTLGYEGSKQVMERSFAQFQADGDIVGVAAELSKAKQEAAALRAELLGRGADAHAEGSEAEASSSSGEGSSRDDERLTQMLEYLDLRAKLTQEEKNAKRRNIEDRHTETVTALRRLRRGEVIPLPKGKKVQLAVVYREDHSKSNPRPGVISVGGFVGRVEPHIFPAAPQTVGSIKLPRDADRHPRRALGIVRAEIGRKGLKGPKRLKRRSGGNSPAVRKLRQELREHPLHGDPAVETMARHADTLRQAEAHVTKLQKRVDSASDTLARTFDRMLQLLTQMDYVEWPEGAEPTITEEGLRLAQIHNGSDLLVATCLRRGIWDDLDPAELAGAVSSLVFENRKASQGSDEVPTEPLAKALGNTYRIWEELSEDERRYRLPVTDLPDMAFATAIHQWTAGAPLGYCLQAAAESGAELTPGDIVRWCRQVIDLLQQIKKTGYSTDIRNKSAEAIQAIRRGVVALNN